MNMYIDKSLSTPSIIPLPHILRRRVPRGSVLKLLTQLVKLLFKMIELISTPNQQCRGIYAPPPSSTLHNVFILNICQFDRPKRYLAVLICIFQINSREECPESLNFGSVLTDAIKPF